MSIRLGFFVGCMILVQGARAEDGKTVEAASQAVAMTAVDAPATQPPLEVRLLPTGVKDGLRAEQVEIKEAVPFLIDDSTKDAPGGGPPARANACPASNVGVLTHGSTIVGSTIGSTNDFVAPCGSNVGAQDEIFEFTVDGPGVWSFDTCTVAACWDTTLSIHEETGGGCPGVVVACDGDGCNVCYYESSVETFLSSTSTYYLIVDGWSTFAYGDFTVTAQLVVPGCASDGDCDDGSFCNGAETCVIATGQCLPGPGNPCTTYEGYSAPCDDALGACVTPDAWVTWQTDTVGSGYFFPQANICPDLASWVFDDVQNSHHTTGVLDFYTTPIRAQSTPPGASPLGTVFLVNQALFTVESGTCIPLAEIAGSQCTGTATVDPGGSPLHDLPCSGTMPLLPNNSGDFDRCEIDFWMAFRTTENGAGMGIAGNKPELGGPAAADEFGVSIIAIEDCPPTGSYSATFFGDDVNLPADFQNAVVCQKPGVQCCHRDCSCSIGTEDDCANAGGTVVCIGTIVDGPCVCGDDGVACPDDCKCELGTVCDQHICKTVTYRTKDGDCLIEAGEKVAFETTIEVINHTDDFWDKVVVGDCFFRDILVTNVHTQQGAAQQFQAGNHKTCIRWRPGDLGPGDSAILVIDAETGVDRRGNQEYTRCGNHKFNNGALLRFIDPHNQAFRTGPLVVSVLTPDAAGDCDGDGCSDQDELDGGTDPHDPGDCID